MRSGKTIWLVDASYLFYAQCSIGSFYQFDYRKLRNKLEIEGTINRAYYLSSTTNPPSEAQDRFHTWLKTARPEGPQMIVKLYELKEQRFECEHCKKEIVFPVQKGVDVGISTLMVKLAYQNNYDTLIVSSGDGDLLDSIKHVKEELNKSVELCVFRNGVSADLQSYADKVYWINDFADEVKK